MRLGRLKGPGGDCGGAQRDKDPGDLAGDLGWPLRSREGRGEEALTGGPGVRGIARGLRGACAGLSGPSAMQERGRVARGMPGLWA